MRFLLTFLLSLPLSAALANELRLNSSTAEEFAMLEGVSTETAAQIIALRDSRGGQLSSVEALRVLNLPPMVLDTIRQEAIIDLPLRNDDRTFNTLDEVMAEFADEPDVRQAQAMAMSYTNTNPELVEGWLSASRSAYLLPKLNLQYEKELDSFSDFDYTATDAGDPEPVIDNARTEDDDKYVVRLEWRLDKLVMSSEQIRVINEAQDIVKLRDKVLDEVTRLYFDRRRLQVDLLLAPPTDLREQIDSELRLQELTANLDALTGGAFTAAL